jgi:hypothetical protein
MRGWAQFGRTNAEHERNVHNVRQERDAAAAAAAAEE